MVSMKLKQNNKGDVLFMGFNQDCNCVTVSTGKGFQIYNRDPFTEITRKDMSEKHNGGIGIIEMLYETNIIALVGGGTHPCWPTNQVILWDAVTMEEVVELSFSSTVLGVKLERWVLLVILQKSICLYSLQDLTFLDTFNIFPSPTSTPICAITRNLTIAAPGLQKGSVTIYYHKSIQPNTYVRQANEYDTPKAVRSDWEERVFVAAHDDSLSQIALTDDGKLVVTASVKGTIFRIFDTNNGETIFEFRRGIERTTIYSLAFSKDGHWLSCASAKGTVHIFSLLHKQKNVYQRPSVIVPSKANHEMCDEEDGVTTYTSTPKPIPTTTDSHTHTSNPYNPNPQTQNSNTHTSSTRNSYTSNTQTDLESDIYPLINDYVPSTHVDISSSTHTHTTASLPNHITTHNKNTINGHYHKHTVNNGHTHIEGGITLNFDNHTHFSHIKNALLPKINQRGKIYNRFSTLFTPTKSSVQFRIPSEKSPCISVFGEDPMQLVVLCSDETLYNVTIDSVGTDGNISASPYKLNPHN